MTETPSFEFLCSTYLDGSISQENLAALEKALAADATMRQRFYRIANLDAALRDWAPICAAQEAWADAARPVANAKRTRWQLWSAAALVFAGILTGFFSSSLVMGRTLSPKESKAIQLPLGNPNFEDITPPPADGCPRSFGKWSGDFTRITSSERGIIPVEGHSMLQFLRADNRVTPPNVGTTSSELWQVVDLNPLRPAFANKPGRVEFSAHFNSTPLPEGQSYAFGICAYAFHGDVSESEYLWEHRHDVAVASTEKEELSDNDPTTWQKLTTQFVVPPEANLILVQIRTCPKPMPKGIKTAVIFPGQYVSNVSLRLLTDSPNP